MRWHNLETRLAMQDVDCKTPTGQTCFDLEACCALQPEHAPTDMPQISAPLHSSPTKRGCPPAPPLGKGVLGLYYGGIGNALLLHHGKPYSVAFLRGTTAMSCCSRKAMQTTIDALDPVDPGTP